MLNADRLRELMLKHDVSQSELARRIGISQQAIGRLLSGDVRGSKHLHRIARELGTTPAYLENEIDDPSATAVLPPPKPTGQTLQLEVVIPGEVALTRMFLGILTACDRLPRDELARELARSLPDGLALLRGQLTYENPPKASDDRQGTAEARDDAGPVRRRA